MCKSEAVPITYLVSPSMTTDGRPAQVDRDSIDLHVSSGATIRSTPAVFIGCAAGQRRIPRLLGRDRELLVVHDSEEEEIDDEADSHDRASPALDVPGGHSSATGYE